MNFRMAGIKCLMAFAFLLVFVTPSSAQTKKPDVIAYYTGNDTVINAYSVKSLTHIIYSFLHLNGDTLAFGSDRQRQILKALTDLKKQNPQLKVMVALGGWGGCAPCSEVFSRDTSRAKFVASVRRIMDNYNADGLDLDWEYPVIEGYPGHSRSLADKDNFTDLIRKLRKSIGKGREISFAAGGFTAFVDSAIDWKAVMPLVDRVNLMSYDLVSGFSRVTGHHTPLYSNKDQKESGDNGVKLLMKAGVPASKIVLGAAFYARAWANVSADRNGIYQSGVFLDFVPYKILYSKYPDTDGYVTYTDPISKAIWRYSAEKKIFMTFDDPTSIKAKTEYCKKLKLGGIMFWELTLDKPEAGLLDVITKTLEK